MTNMSQASNEDPDPNSWVWSVPVTEPGSSTMNETGTAPDIISYEDNFPQDYDDPPNQLTGIAILLIASSFFGAILGLVSFLFLGKGALISILTYFLSGVAFFISSVIIGFIRKK